MIISAYLGKSMEKHTPGPWEVVGQFVRTPFRHGEPDAAGLMVADVRFGIWPPEEHAANARLIAAAPDLLAALTALVAVYEDEFGMIAPEMDAALAAISKATGLAIPSSRSAA